MAPVSSTISASQKATRRPALTTHPVAVSQVPIVTFRIRLIFSSTFDEKTGSAPTWVIVAAPIASSANAARKPPGITPAGLAKRSSARIRQVVLPGVDLSTQDRPRVSAPLAGTWMRVSEATSGLQRGAEEGQDVLEPAGELVGRQRVPVEQRFDERHVAEPGEERAVAREQQLFGVVAAEAASRHLALEEHLGAGEQRP